MNFSGSRPKGVIPTLAQSLESPPPIGGGLFYGKDQGAKPSTQAGCLSAGDKRKFVTCPGGGIGRHAGLKIP